MNNKNVTKHTRAGFYGKKIYCPHCGNRHVVYHFGWSALGCSDCGEMVEKTEWLLEQS
jgi:ribosomal protein S27E